MALPLTNLDDRRWADLVDEGRALIPFYSPEWTDHNVHDPGVTLIELFAWISEMDVYRLNRIPDARRRKFLGMVGVEPQPPRGARTAVAFHVTGDESTDLPQGVEVEGKDLLGMATLFRTLDSVAIRPGTLVAIQGGRNSQELIDLSGRLEREGTIAPFGEDPQRGAVLYLGFDFGAVGSLKPPEKTEEAVDLYFVVQGSDDEERRRLEQRTCEAWSACRSPQLADHCNKRQSPNYGHDPCRDAPKLLKHHSVQLVWEVYVGSGTWQRLKETKVRDETRAFTLSGKMAVKLPASMKLGRFGAVDAHLYYLRCRVLSGAYDVAPKLQAVLLNGVAAEQEAPVGSLAWTVAENASIEGPEPGAGDWASFDLEFDDTKQISRLVFGATDAPRFRVLAYKRPEWGTVGSLCIEAEEIGFGSGAPYQEVVLSETLVAGSNLGLFTAENGTWRRWISRCDFDASGPADAHCLLDPREGVVAFGDGWHGRAVPVGVPIVASYDSTRGKAGNLGARAIDRLAASVHNQAVLGKKYKELQKQGLTVTNPLPAGGGSPGETLSEAASRAFDKVDKTDRAVTLTDCEELAKKTPGVRLARVKAWPNLHAVFPCLRAPGFITLVIVPYLPADRPTPCPRLRHAVSGYLASRRILGTRVDVVGPTYVEVRVRAKVRAQQGVSPSGLEQRVRHALNDFFHPLSGGPERTGWPFGRDVYRSEVLQIIDETPGTDYVDSLELTTGTGAATCANVCIPPTGLVAPGTHEINILRGQP